MANEQPLTAEDAQEFLRPTETGGGGQWGAPSQGHGRTEAAEIAEELSRNPGLRLKLLEDPIAAIKMAVPTKRLRLGVDKETVTLRRQVLAELSRIPPAHPEEASSRHAELVIRQFFEQAIRNPQVSFTITIAMSCTVLVMGLALTITGVVVGLTTSDKELIAAAFGGSGVIGSLGAVYTLARRGVDMANANHAQIRVILASYASELGHLRALNLQTLEDVTEVNEKIRAAMDEAVRLIQENVKSEGVPESAKPQLTQTPAPAA